MKASEILDKASQHMRDRAATYDKPDGERSMAKTVAVFNKFHGTSLTEAQGWHFMQVLKAVRMFTDIKKYHADSAEDGIAYGALMAEALATKEENSKPVTGAYWTIWEGGDNPVPGHKVEFLIREQGCAVTPVPRSNYSNSLTWKHGSREADIIKYRVVA